MTTDFTVNIESKLFLSVIIFRAQCTKLDLPSYMLHTAAHHTGCTGGENQLLRFHNNNKKPILNTENKFCQ